MALRRPAAAGRGRGKGTGRGRQKGFRHSEATRAKIQFRRLQAEHGKERRAVHALEDAIAPSVAQQTAFKVFGAAPLHEQASKERYVLIDGTVAAAPTVKPTSQAAELRDRGVFSHVVAQARGLAEFIHPSGDGADDVEFVFMTVNHDDASMWVQKPATAGRGATGPIGMLERRLNMRGKNVHLPALNQVQHVFTQRRVAAAVEGEGGDPQTLLCGAEVHTPATILPAANTATIRHHLVEWQVASAEGTGHKVDPDPARPLSRAISEAPWLLSVYTQDNLTLNSCITALEERLLSLNSSVNLRRDAGQATQLVLSCHGHSCVLCMRALIDSGKVADKLVRLAGQLESGRRQVDLVRAVEAEVKDRFRYVLVRELPEEVSRWKAKSLELLQLSRCARDLTLEDEAMIVRVGSNWDAREIVHMCPPDCEMGCRRQRPVERAKFALRYTQRACVACVAGKVTKPLKYRWKGFEEAAGWTVRGRRMHDLLRAAFTRIYPRSVVDKAAKKLNDAAAAGLVLDDGELRRLNKNIRGGDIIAWFAMIIVSVCSKPRQAGGPTVKQ